MVLNSGRRTRRFLPLQFGLRGLFIAVTMVAVCISAFVRRVREQQAVARLILASGGEIFYDFQEGPRGIYGLHPNARVDFPEWLVAALGEDFFADVAHVSLVRGHNAADGAQIEHAESLVRRLSAFPRLRALSIDGEPIDDDALRVIAGLERLESLTISNAPWRISDAEVAGIVRLPELVWLSLDNCSMSDESLRTLSSLPSLEHLSVEGSQVSDRGITYLRGMRSLRVLRLRGSGVILAREALGALNTLTALDELDLSGAKVTSRSFKHLSGFPRLRVLNLSHNSDFGNDGMRAVGRLSSLEVVKLAGTNVTSEGTKYLTSLKKIRSVDLSENAAITDDCLHYLSVLASLEELKLRRTGVTSKGLESLSRLVKLALLDLSENAAILDDAIVHITKLTRLRELDLHKTMLAPSGKLSDLAVRQLASLPGLTLLDLACTGADTSHVRMALPHCTVLSSLAGDVGLRKTVEPAGYSELILFLLCRDLNSSGSVGRQSSEAIPPAEVLPTAAIAARMIRLADAADARPALPSQRRVLETFSHPLGTGRADPRSPADDARRLDELVHRDELMNRLYQAAVDFQAADALTAYIEYFEHLKTEWSLTDVEIEEYRMAAKYKRDCLRDAGAQLALQPGTSREESADEVLRIWAKTRPTSEQ